MATLGELSQVLGLKVSALKRKARMLGIALPRGDEPLPDSDAATLSTMARRSPSELRAYREGLESLLRPVPSETDADNTKAGQARSKAPVLATRILPTSLDLAVLSPAAVTLLIHRIESQFWERLRRDFRTLAGPTLDRELWRMTQELRTHLEQELRNGLPGRVEEVERVSAQLNAGFYQFAGAFDKRVRAIKNCTDALAQLKADVTALERGLSAHRDAALPARVEELERVSAQLSTGFYQFASDLDKRLQAIKNNADGIVQLKADVTAQATKVNAKLEDLYLSLFLLRQSLDESNGVDASTQEALEQFRTGFSTTLSEFDSLLRDLLRRQERLAGEVALFRGDRDKAEAHLAHIKRVAATSDDFAPLRATIEPQHAVAILRELGIYCPETILLTCLRAIESCGALMLKGPPGVGKTTIARVLPRLFWPHEAGELVSVHSASHDWQSFDVVGGKWVIGDQIVPWLGLFTKAVMTCIERSGRHWLVVDDINRSDVDRCFSGLLDVVADIPKGANLEIPGSAIVLKVPRSFRMIASINDWDAPQVFPISEAFLSRFVVVDVGYPTSQDERAGIVKLVGTDGTDAPIAAYLTLINALRGRVAIEHQQCELGWRCTTTIFSQVAREMVIEPRFFHAKLDQALADHLVSRLARASLDALDAALELMDAHEYPLSTSALHSGLRRHGS